SGGVRFYHVSRHDEPNLSGRGRRTLSLGSASEFVFALFHHLFRPATLVLPSRFPSRLCSCDLSGLHAASGMGRKKYPPADRRALFRPVRVLHGLPWGAGAVETRLWSPHFFLSHGGPGRRSGRRVGSFGLSPYFPRLLGIPAGLVALHAAPVRGAGAG